MLLLISKVRLHLHFTSPAKFPYWMGSMFRGGFGQNLRRAICPDPDAECYSCEQHSKCLFYYTHMKDRAKRGYAPPSKPIILIPPFFGRAMEVEKDAHLTLDVLFFGDFRRYLPHLTLGLNFLGQVGLGSTRHYGLSRFEVEKGVCIFSGKTVYERGVIMPANLKSVNAQDAPSYPGTHVKIGFKTPFTGSHFPLTPNRLLWMIRRRLIGFVNEYGDGSQVADFKCDGKIVTHSVHIHDLQRRSARSEKKYFKGYTGVVDYEFTELDDTGRWLLNLGFIIGCGPDSSFGCGFLQDLTDTASDS